MTIKPSIIGLMWLMSISLHAQNFQVTGTSIIDPEGKEFLAKGINVNGPHWPWKRSTVEDVELIADVWKFNTIRVNAFPRLDFIKTNLDLYAIVESYTSRKVVTMIEVHDYTGTYPGIKEDYPSLQELTAWWVDKANRYKDNPYVWFNIMNEPGSNQPVPELWKELHEHVIKAIRAAGAENIIVLDGHHFGQEGGYKDTAWSGILKYGPYFRDNYNNIVFSLHVYSLWKDAEDRFEEYVGEVKKKNLAFLFGEYGESDRYNESATEGMFRIAFRHKLGRIAWHWTSENNAGNDLTRLTSIGGGWEIDIKDGSKPTNLTWMGNLIWEDNHNTLQLAEIKMSGPPVMNGGFEELLYGWQNYGGGEIVHGKDSVQSGDNALKIPVGKSGGGIGQLALLQPNTTYTFSAWGKWLGVPKKPARIGIRYKTKNGNKQQVLSFTDEDFVQKSIKFTTPANIESADIYIIKEDPELSFILDEIEID